MKLSNKTKRTIKDDAQRMKISKKKAKEIELKALKTIKSLPPGSEEEDEEMYKIIIFGDYVHEYVKNISKLVKEKCNGNI